MSARHLAAFRASRCSCPERGDWKICVLCSSHQRSLDGAGRAAGKSGTEGVDVVMLSSSDSFGKCSASCCLLFDGSERAFSDGARECGGLFLEHRAVVVSFRLDRNLDGYGVVAMPWIVLSDDFLASFGDEGYVVGSESCDASVVEEGERFSTGASCDASAVCHLEQIFQGRGDRGAQRRLEQIG